MPCVPVMAGIVDNKGVRRLVYPRTGREQTAAYGVQMQNLANFQAELLLKALIIKSIINLLNLPEHDISNGHFSNLDFSTFLVLFTSRAKTVNIHLLCLSLFTIKIYVMYL